MNHRNTTPVPNDFFDKVVGTLSGSAIRVYLKIVRSTYGWRDTDGNIKGRDWIAHSQFEKYGVSNRSITNAIEELQAKNLIRITDINNRPLNNPQDRKRAKKVYYALNTQETANTTLYQAKNDQKPPQELRSTKEIYSQKYNAEEKIPDNVRIQQILDEERLKQSRRDKWL